MLPTVYVATQGQPSSKGVDIACNPAACALSAQQRSRQPQAKVSCSRIVRYVQEPQLPKTEAGGEGALHAAQVSLGVSFCTAGASAQAASRHAIAAQQLDSVKLGRGQSCGACLQAVPREPYRHAFI